VKTLIAYRSRYGCTRRYAELLADRLGGRPGGGQLTVADLGRERRLSPAGFELVLLGSPVYAGAVPAGVTRFCERHRAALLGRPVGLFICCLYEGERARAQLDAAYPEWLSLHAFGRWALGGEIRPEALGFFDRLLVRAMGRSLGGISRFRAGDLEPILDGLARLGGPGGLKS
jgi:menaquinone-dependent protoporphyrinogen oxidase